MVGEGRGEEVSIDGRKFDGGQQTLEVKSTNSQN
jgi:hypothetical protein